MKICVIIPVYNAAKHIGSAAASVLRHGYPLLVVCDGCTDGTLEIVSSIAGVEVAAYGRNRGKGCAIRHGMRRAMQLGYTHAITFDGDGQHLAADIDGLKEKAMANPNAIIVGSRQFNNANMPSGSRFANRFSNFWFRLQTGIALPDTQTGFRCYPLHKMGSMRIFTNRYEAELEILARCAWRNIKLIPQPINVYYPDERERITHFRKGWDFCRISLLNIALCVLAVVYGYPSMVVRKFLTQNE
jgi:glycosyltransferase involved in cell wall biosynthesis